MESKDARVLVLLRLGVSMGRPAACRWEGEAMTRYAARAYGHVLELFYQRPKPAALDVPIICLRRDAADATNGSGDPLPEFAPRGTFYYSSVPAATAAMFAGAARSLVDVGQARVALDAKRPPRKGKAPPEVWAVARVVTANDRPAIRPLDLTLVAPAAVAMADDFLAGAMPAEAWLDWLVEHDARAAAWLAREAARRC